MRIVVASGKGGTGKTLVATSLALVAQELGRTALIDADVEAPNAGLFLELDLEASWPVEVQVPVIDQSRCTHCGRCAEVCQFKAIAALPKATLVFSELCHGCGSCYLNCPEGAISEVPHPIGWIEEGQAGGMCFARGTLEVGEAMATPIIHALKRHAAQAGWDNDLLIMDAPPGTACPVIEALRGADVALLVTEPTPFGLHDLELAVGVARDVLHLPTGIVLNKDSEGNSQVEDYCQREGLPILLRIPLQREIAQAYSAGNPLVRAMPEFGAAFLTLLRALVRLTERSAA